MRGCPHHRHQENANENSEMLLEWPKFRTLPTPNTEEDVEQELAFLLGMLNGIAALEDSFEIC